MTTSAEFVGRFPEFGDAPADLVDSHLAAATRRTPVKVWGPLWADGIYLRTADTLARSPFGRKMRMVEKGVTAYEKDLHTLVRRVAVGRGRVTG